MRIEIIFKIILLPVIVAMYFFEAWILIIALPVALIHKGVEKIYNYEKKDSK